MSLSRIGRLASIFALSGGLLACTVQEVPLKPPQAPSGPPLENLIVGKGPWQPYVGSPRNIRRSHGGKGSAWSSLRMAPEERSTLPYQPSRQTKRVVGLPDVVRSKILAEIATGSIEGTTSHGSARYTYRRVLARDGCHLVRVNLAEGGVVSPLSSMKICGTI